MYLYVHIYRVMAQTAVHTPASVNPSPDVLPPSSHGRRSPPSHRAPETGLAAGTTYGTPFPLPPLSATVITAIVSLTLPYLHSPSKRLLRYGPMVHIAATSLRPDAPLIPPNQPFAWLPQPRHHGSHARHGSFDTSSEGQTRCGRADRSTMPTTCLPTGCWYLSRCSLAG